MTSLHACERALAASFIAVGMGLAIAPTASADDPPPAPGPGAPPAPWLAGPAPQADAPAPGLPADGALPAAIAPPAAPADGGDVTKAACKQFSRALDYAASNYEDFAYNIAGSGSYVNYGDPSVANSNVVGRTALRQAAAVALDASSVPGLQPEIADPMRQWSFDATRLLLTMGLRGNGDALDGAATDMNRDAKNVQMACAQAGTPA
jgi:hypothetical protein